MTGTSLLSLECHDTQTGTIGTSPAIEAPPKSDDLLAPLKSAPYAPDTMTDLEAGATRNLPCNSNVREEYHCLDLHIQDSNCFTTSDGSPVPSSLELRIE